MVARLSNGSALCKGGRQSWSETKRRRKKESHTGGESDKGGEASERGRASRIVEGVASKGDGTGAERGGNGREKEAE